LAFRGTLLRHVRGIPFVYSVQDVYPDIARDLNVLRASWLYRPLDWIASRLYRQAAFAVTLSAAMGTTLIAKGVKADRCKIIANWADTETLVPLQKDRSMAAELGLGDSFVVLYSGNVGLSQALDAVISAASLLTELPITFAIVGEGNALED
jgi:colanic acid biosynthesis glycosyl transferase WcaI